MERKPKVIVVQNPVKYQHGNQNYRVRTKSHIRKSRESQIQQNITRKSTGYNIDIVLTSVALTTYILICLIKKFIKLPDLVLQLWAYVK